MITWKTHSNIYIARNPQDGIYSFDLLSLDERMIGVVLPRNAAEQKQLIHELNTNRVNLNQYRVLFMGGI